MKRQIVAALLVLSCALWASTAYAWPWDTAIEKAGDVAIAVVEGKAKATVAQAEAQAQIVIARAARDMMPHIILLASIVFGALCILAPGYLGMQAFKLWMQFAADGKITRRELAFGGVSAVVLVISMWFSFKFGSFLMGIAENGLLSLAG